MNQNDVVHILNGDALKERFPSTIDGQILIARECLVQGDISGNNLTDLFNTRAKFIHTTFPEYSIADYHKNVSSEFLKILEIKENTDINLWFEDDLFCQVNLWFVLHLIFSKNQQNKVFLIRPEKHNQYGFGKYDTEGLNDLYLKRIELVHTDKIATLWTHYQEEMYDTLLKTADEVKETYPFVLTAVKAHLQRLPKEGYLGKPKEVLMEIINDLKTEDFGLVFKEFCRRLPIYGFGDAQVQVLLRELKDN